MIRKEEQPTLEDFERIADDLWCDVRGAMTAAVLKFARRRHTWHVLGIGSLLFLVVMAALGFYYTARRLAWDITPTFVLILGLILLHALLLRWLFLARRRLAIEQARMRREKARTQAAEGSPELAPVDENEVDIPAIDARTRQLFRNVIFFGLIAGLLIVWSDMLPALKALERVQLLPSVQILEDQSGLLPEPNGEFVAAATDQAPAMPGDETPPPDEHATGSTPSPTMSGIPPATPQGTVGALSETRLTLADVGLALVIVLVMLAATRNLPGLLEMVLLQRLRLDKGLRYAIITITRYLIVTIGCVAAFGALGIGWSKVQPSRPPRAAPRCNTPPGRRNSRHPRGRCIRR